MGAWREDGPTFGIINFANADMVGHTGVIPAAVSAIETVDTCLGEIVRAVHESGGAMIITADHGNADNMLEPDGSPQHRALAEPGAGDRHRARAWSCATGVLADVAPTVLELLGYEQPARHDRRFPDQALTL